MPTKSELCIRCGDCCKFFILEIRRPAFPQEIIDWKEWMVARGIIFIREHSGWWRIKIPFQCPHLRIVEKDSLIMTPEHPKDSLHYCEIYGSHPTVCKKFDGRLESSRDGLKCLWLTEKIDQ
jgi:Fe-S-cluster containining protein